MEKIYTVFGDSREYSGWRMWAVRAFDNKADADQFAEPQTIQGEVQP